MGTSRTPNSTDNQHNSKSSDILINEEIPNTPFRVVGNDEKGYFIALGIHRLCEYQKTAHTAIDMLNTNSWEIIINTITTVIHAVNLVKEQEKANPKNQ